MKILNPVKRIWGSLKRDEQINAPETEILLLNILMELQVISELLKHEGVGQMSNVALRKQILDE